MRPIYVSFVSKAILWDRRCCNYTTHAHPNNHPSLCPRFLSHMKARPEDPRPPRFLSSTFMPQPPSQGTTQAAHILVVPKTQTLEGYFTPERRKYAIKTRGLITLRRSVVSAPRLPLPAAPPPSATPPRRYALHSDSGRQQSGPYTVPASPSGGGHPASEEDDAPQPAAVSGRESADLDRKLSSGPAGPERPKSRVSTVSHGSLSDFSRPPSSLFSRSTDLASGRSSVLSDTADSGPEGSVCLSPLHPFPVVELPLASPPATSHQSSAKATTPPLHKQVFGQTKPLCPPLASSIHPESSSNSTQTPENLHNATTLDPDPDPSLDSDRGLVTLTFPSTTWSSCPGSQTTPPRSASGAKLTPSPPVSRPGSRCWPVLPPISPVRGRCGTAASRYSELSCSPSHVFDELEAIAPRSTSCLSLDEASDSSGCTSPVTELSPGLAALTVGCDSGNLGSLSRVQLLLLDRPAPEMLQGSFSLEEELSTVEDWSDPMMQYDPGWSSAGVSRPLTAGSISERCDSAGKVQENKSNSSEEGSWSPSSWIIDPSPSFSMFRSSPWPSSHSSHTDELGHSEDESNYPGWREHVESSAAGSRPEIPDNMNEENSARMEERKTKVLHMLSKLQDVTPRKSNSYNKCHSNFEDFDFLAKYCIFSQEKLAEYKRAFEVEDDDGDGYISCLQVLLALKNIIPPELLSDEEEIYVYRILEMVDFRVTDGLVDLRLFAVIASLAQKIATMDEFMRSLISNMDFRSLEVRLFKVKEQRGDTGAQQGFISAEQLLLELKAGGIHLEQEAAIRMELQHIPPLDLLDFLAYLPLFMIIHKSVISNPLSDSSNL